MLLHTPLYTFHIFEYTFSTLMTAQWSVFSIFLIVLLISQHQSDGIIYPFNFFPVKQNKPPTLPNCNWSLLCVVSFSFLDLPSKCLLSPHFCRCVAACIKVEAINSHSFGPDENWFCFISNVVKSLQPNAYPWGVKKNGDESCIFDIDLKLA